MPKENIKNEFYKRIFKAIRKKRNLTQKQYGEIIGKKEITVRKYEGGQLKVSEELLYILIKKLNILKSQFIELVTSPDIVADLIDEKSNDYINNEFITDMIIDFYFDVSDTELIFVPICPKSQDENINKNYTERLNRKCKDDIYFFISQVVHLNDKEKFITDEEMLDLSDKTISFLNFLLKEKKINND